ncbi:hypothetical protein BH18ACI1_BH18ACI1_04840 [soil metagenome]
MKIILKNAILFIALSIAFSNFTACTNPASTQKGPVDETAPPASNNNSAETKSSSYPNAPAGIMQPEIKDVDGNAFKLEDKKGKVVLVNLWAIWCGPCIAEMPHLVEMQEKYKDQGFEIVGLNIGDNEGQHEPEENVKAFAEKMKLNYQLGYADDKLTGEFNKITRMGGIPQSFLVNREGKLINVFQGGGSRVVNQMKEAVEKVMNE